MKNAKKVLISIQRLTELKNISLVESFLLFSDAILSGDYTKFKRFGFKISDSGEDLPYIIWRITRWYEDKKLDEV